MIGPLENRLVHIDTQTLIEDFHRVAVLAGLNIPEKALTAEVVPAPHVPPSLRRGKMAVYVFFCRGECLKVGKAGPRSGARCTTQHYRPNSSRSNLAKSLLGARAEMGLPEFSTSEVGAWIRENADRYNFLLDAECGIQALTLLEVFLQCRLNQGSRASPANDSRCCIGMSNKVLTAAVQHAF